jgi:hypothetical protein
MSHFAKVFHGTVIDVIVAEQDYIDAVPHSHGVEWVKTSYRTYGGKHPEKTPLRKNYAGVGFTYDKIRDAFIPVKPFTSWVLNEDTCLWEPPIPIPSDGVDYRWDELTKSWVKP